MTFSIEHLCLSQSVSLALPVVGSSLAAIFVQCPILAESSVNRCLLFDERYFNVFLCIPSKARVNASNIF